MRFASLLLLVVVSIRAQAAVWTLTDPADETYKNEPVRLRADLPDSATPGEFRVLRDGRPVGCQIEEIAGRWWCPTSTGQSPPRRS